MTDAASRQWLLELTNWLALVHPHLATPNRILPTEKEIMIFDAEHTPRKFLEWYDALHGTGEVTAARTGSMVDLRVTGKINGRQVTVTMLLDQAPHLKQIADLHLRQRTVIDVKLLRAVAILGSEAA